VTDVSGQQPLIVRGPYLVRSAALDNNVLTIRADFNQSSALDLFRAVDTATVEILGVPKGATAVVLNGDAVAHTVSDTGSWVVRVDFEPPAIPVPDLAALEWRYLDALSELQASYSDAPWPDASHASTNNTYLQSPLTPTSLYASDYGFHAGGALLFRGHFTATGAETSLTLHTQGGAAFASLAFLNDVFLGSWPGNATASSHRDTYPVRLTPGQPCVLTVVLDNTGNAQNALVGGDEMKAPRGILEYGFQTSGGAGPEVKWKVTGNLGGESYVDKVRGPLNEGGLFAERMGYHQPGAPADRFVVGGGVSPMKGIDQPGVGFWSAEMVLDIPKEKWDVPLSFELPAIDPAGSGSYRAVLWVNGFRKCTSLSQCLDRPPFTAQLPGSRDMHTSISHLTRPGYLLHHPAQPT